MSSGIKRPRIDATQSGQPMPPDALYSQPNSMTDVQLIVKPDVGNSRTFYLCQQPLRLVSPVWNDALANAPPLEKDEKWHTIEISNASPLGMLYLLSHFYPGAEPMPMASSDAVIDAVRLSHRYDITSVLVKLKREALATGNFMTMLALDEVLLGNEGKEFDKGNYDWRVRQNMLVTIAKYGGNFNDCYQHFLTKLPKELLARLCFDAVSFVYRDYGTASLVLKDPHNKEWSSVRW
jgi:hypothetical protein